MFKYVINNYLLKLYNNQSRIKNMNYLHITQQISLSTCAVSIGKISGLKEYFFSFYESYMVKRNTIIFVELSYFIIYYTNNFDIIY